MTRLPRGRLAEKDVEAFDLSKLSFAATVQHTSLDTTMADTFATKDPDAMAGCIIGQLSPLDGALGDAGELTAGEIPDVKLTRTASKTVDDLRDLGEPVYLDVLDFLTDDVGGPLTSTITADVKAEVRVPTEAVRAAVGGGTLPVGPDGSEAATLDAARVIAAAATGASYIVEGMPDLDLAAALPLVELPKVEVVAKAEVKLEGDAKAKAAGMELGAKGSATAKVTQVLELSDAVTDEQRRAMFSSAAANVGRT